jgi:NhaC family Na+:H+ antiporter
MFRDEFAKRGLAPQVLSRAVEDSGTVTSVLVPWNTCGAYISGVLGVSTIAYLPFCFFNILSPMLDVLFGFVGFKVPSAEPEGSGAEQQHAGEGQPGDEHGGEGRDREHPAATPEQ